MDVRNELIWLKKRADSRLL